MLRLRIAVLIALMLCVFETSTASGQEKTPSHPRSIVGVALGGGSARGMAHAGVLLWLEEHHIPVDRIAGNSTGALLGAAYATGISASEIKTMLRTADWDTVLRPDIAYLSKSFRRKEDDLEFSIKLEAGLRQGFRLQSGLNPAHHLGLWISRMLLPYSGVKSFDDLPIPFRCVATDMEKGAVVVFDRGTLAPAVRASMSLPGTYDPVRLNGRLFADGGILNNIPVDVALEMGSDVVIAVRVGPKAEEKTAETIGGIANRAISLMMQNLEKPGLRQADVVIVPDLDGLTGGDFRKSEEMVARGYQAAEAQKEALLRYALTDEGWAEYRAFIEARKHPRSGPLTFVEVNGVSDGASTQIAQQLSRHIGRAPDPKEIERDLNRIIGLGRYASATYGRSVLSEGLGLGVDIREKSYGPPFVRFSLDANNENADINLNLGSRMTFMDVTGLGSEWRIGTSLGSVVSFNTELYQPLGGRRPVHGGAFVSPRATYARTSESLYAGNELAAIYGRQRTGLGLDLGWNSGNTRLRAGYDASYVRNTTRIGSPLLPKSSGAEHVLETRLEYDGQNAAYLPSRGLRLRASAKWFVEAPDADRAFGTLDGALQVAHPLGGNRIATLRVSGGATFFGTAPILYEFNLGGAGRLGAFPTYAFRGPDYLLGSVGHKFPVGRLPKLLGGRLYLDTTIEAGSVFDDISHARLKSSVTAGFTADTLLGPFFAGLSVSHEGDVRAYFMVGRLVR